MKHFSWLLLAATLLATPATAQLPPSLRSANIPAPVDPDAIPLYPAGTLPRSSVVEQWSRLSGTFAGRAVSDRMIRNVTRPTITPVLPDPAKATGAAVIVAPGGAFQSLAIDHEGYAVARALADRGIAAFVLKYRLNETPADEAEMAARMARIMTGAGSGNVRPSISEPRAAEDALQALRLVRGRASGWRIDPKRVGMIGFSAGAMTSLQAVLTGKPEDRPAFFGYIYGPMLPVDVPTEAPPMFAAFALDDGLFGRQGFGIVEAWHKAGRPVELHAYEKGDHGFGLGIPGTTTTLMIDQFRAWLESRGLLGASAPR
jgi:acetyl esterase/lipase